LEQRLALYKVRIEYIACHEHGINIFLRGDSCYLFDAFDPPLTKDRASVARDVRKLFAYLPVGSVQKGYHQKVLRVGGANLPLLSA
jgi:hypothetical protein